MFWGKPGCRRKSEKKVLELRLTVGGKTSQVTVVCHSEKSCLSRPEI